MTIHDTPTILDAALDALAHGLAVVPPKEDGSKRPDGEWKTYQQRLPTRDEITSWYRTGRTGLGIVTGAVSGNLEMLEFEGRAIEENVGEVFADLAAAAGLTQLVDRVNAGYCETTPTGGLHLLYRVTGPVAGNLKLARRPATATELAANPQDPIRVLIETRGEGGYVVTAPSHGTVHPNGGGWVLLNGSFDTIATISEDERDQLHRIARALDTLPAEHTPTRAASPAPLLNGDGRPGDDYNAAADTPYRTLHLLERYGWTEVFRRPHNGHDDVHLRRPGKSIGTSAVLHMDAGTLVNFSSSVACFEQEQGYTPFAVHTLLEHGGDYQAAARALRPERQRDDLSWARIDGVDAAAGQPPAPSSSLHLPEELWTARPVLEHIRQAARARRVAPDAVLGAVLARIAAITPHMVELPAIIGSPMGLTFYAGIVGPPAAGKSAAAAVAGDLLPAPKHVQDRVPIGSGEGFVEILFDLVTEEGENGKKVKVKRQTRYAAIFHIDEGAVLSDLANRQGTTLLPTLRTAYTHGTLGNANASSERKRILDGKAYVYGVTLGIQPELAGPLLADTAAGTPQRFVWVMATDPDAPRQRTDWPDVLPWAPPDHDNLDAIAIVRTGQRRFQLDVDAAIWNEVDNARVEVMHGAAATAGDSHRDLVRLKVAALLALLDRRLTVSVEDWYLAGIIDANSRKIRRSVENTLEVVERSREQAAIDRHARRELGVETSRETKVLASAARAIARLVRRHHEAGEHGDEGCAKRCCHGATNQRMRGVVDLDDALNEAARLQWIKPVGERWMPGEARPV